MKKARAASPKASVCLSMKPCARRRSHAGSKPQPYERTDTRQGHANGFKPKTLATRIGPIQFKVPQVRGDLEFYPNALEKGIRSETSPQAGPRRNVCARFVHLQSHSKPSPNNSACHSRPVPHPQVQPVRRPIGRRTGKHSAIDPWVVSPYVFIDARYEKVRQGGRLLDCAVLIALGIGLEGKRSILGVSVALSEAEVQWRTLSRFAAKARPAGVLLLVSDDHAGLGAARTAVFPASTLPTLPVSFAAKRPGTYVPRLDQRASVAQAIRTVFDCPDRLSAQARLKEVVATYAPTAPRAGRLDGVKISRKAWPSSTFPTAHRPPAAHHEQLRWNG